MNDKPATVVLDGFTMDPGDLDWSALEELTDLKRYERTQSSQIISRSVDAEILIVNKIVLRASELDQLPNLKCICITATGYDNVDIQAASGRGIIVCNVSGYSTESVAQHVFALLLALTNKVESHHQSVTSGDWSTSEDFAYTLHKVPEIAGKTLGVIGYGKIGKRVAAVGHAFGMKVLATRKSSAKAEEAFVRICDLEEVLNNADVISLHAPLTPETHELINQDRLAIMKNGAFLINTGRGALVQENDLLEALESGHLGGAALDVLSQEPPPADHPLLSAPNCIITPHMAWASFDARKRLLAETTENVRGYILGTPQNQLA